LVRDLWPRRADLGDAIGVLAYNLGMRADKPRFGRFSYVEKVEYWALIWGTIVMAVTGLIMWFDNSSMRNLTKHGYEIARLIHFFEAWLATLSILCWHLYFVAFNPDSYPMSLAWLTGTISEEEMEEEHPLELARIKATEAAVAAAAAAKPAQTDDAAAPPTGPPGPKAR
jgi:cytochrome b subunit of formate dehydrogenase